jgi:hypothetical protein
MALKEDSKVEVTIEADPEAIKPKKWPTGDNLIRPLSAILVVVGRSSRNFP